MREELVLEERRISARGERNQYERREELAKEERGISARG